MNEPSIMDEEGFSKKIVSRSSQSHDEGVFNMPSRSVTKEIREKDRQHKLSVVLPSGRSRSPVTVQEWVAALPDHAEDGFEKNMHDIKICSGDETDSLCGSNQTRTANRGTQCVRNSLERPCHPPRSTSPQTAECKGDAEGSEGGGPRAPKRCQTIQTRERKQGRAGTKHG